MKTSFNPGSIHVRVGLQNAAFDDAMRRGELEEASNILNGPLRTYAAVFMTPSELEEWDDRPNFAVGDSRSINRVSRDMENRRIELLRHLRKAIGVLATAPDEEGDSSTLDDDMPETVTP